ncbi:MAG TPA: AAA family ATPase, partial [Candidatus Bathyarchaeia archaeon]|nr:AAA family ATPase [Candidatus Bathyarchaeia archaeon]
MNQTLNELELLIKSRNPVILFETSDENYSLVQIKQVARRLRYVYYWWSVTTGLVRDDKGTAYYQTDRPKMLLDNIQTLLSSPGAMVPGIFVLKDFEKYLEDHLVLRAFKDLMHSIRNRSDTIILLSSSSKIPADIQKDVVLLTGGFPDEKEILASINNVHQEMCKYDPVYDVKLMEEEKLKMIQLLRGMTVQQIENIVTRCLIDDFVLDFKDLKTIENYRKKIFDHDNLLEFCSSEKVSQIAGFSNLKSWIAERKHAFFSKSNDLPSPRGVMLIGVQGCGKSLAAKALACEMGLPLYRLDVAGLYGKFIGETEESLRKVLKIIEQLAPICLWIDEIEKAFAQGSADTDGGVSQRILGTFLTWMQERQCACFVIATANEVFKLPPEFLRKGRFDEIFFVDLPDRHVRKKLFEVLLTKKGIS